jgi:uncharacterized protein YtpQ (UPF0354 family)
MQFIKRLLQSLLVALGLFSACSKSDILTPARFTDEFVKAMRKSESSLKIEVVSEMQLKVTPANGRESTLFLDNAYSSYRQDPQSKKDIIKRYVAAGLETVSASKSSPALDSNRIVPIVKDRPWLDEVRKSLMDRGAKETPEDVYDELNADLIIVYAEDSPKNIRYLTPKDLEKARLDRNTLKTLASKNLLKLLPKIERHGTGGFYMITAGGDYEASLLVIDSIWNDLQKDVHGDVVVAIPNRDLLIVTGSKDRQGIEKMKQLVQKSYSEGSYRLTPKLFAYRGGRFIEFPN